MPDGHSLFLFILAGLALNITPGPDMLYVAARSSAEGSRAGIVSALGIGAGTLVHITALALGLSALMQAVPLAYEVVRWTGAAYLVYLGARMLINPPSLDPHVTIKRASLWAIFRQGVLTNVLNPKVALFFLAFLPQFIDSSRGSAAFQIVMLGLIFNLNGTLVNIGVALGASSLRARFLSAKSSSSKILGRAVGALFIGLGVRVALSSK